jgi:molybdopterin molybdotransferase
MALVISVEEALEILRQACVSADAECVPLTSALHRVLARDVRSDVACPPFDTSAMDGYAVRLADVSSGQAPAERPGLVAAGDLPGARLSRSEAVRVMTGAPIPDGTEAIVPVEDVRRDNGRIFARVVPRAGHHIRRRAEVLEAGATLLGRGTRLSPSDLALGALAGADPIEVHRRPRVSIAVTGSELVAASARPGPGQLRDSNGPMLSALCGARGVNASLRVAVKDEDGAVRRLFTEAWRDEDLLITSGGVSAGDLDLLPEEARRSGFEILFHRVAVRPGKPVALGRRGSTLWLGLPGNPVSASTCFHLFARPALDCLEGDAHPGPRVRRARLARDLAVKGERETYRDAVLEDDVDGGARVSPSESRGSHDLLAHARANALIRIPAGAGKLRAGSPVDCVILER